MSFNHLKTRPDTYQAKVEGVFVHRAVFGLQFVVENIRYLGPRTAQQVFTHDNYSNAGRADVFLRTGLDDAKA